MTVEGRARRGETYYSWVTRMAARPDEREAVSFFSTSMVEPFDLLQTVVEAVMKEPARARFRSVFGRGHPLLIEALASLYDAPSDQILCTTGALSGMSLVLRAFLPPRSRVVIENPHLDMLAAMARACGAEVDLVARSLETGRIEPEALSAALRPETRLIVITNLHNPSGHELSDTDLLGLAEIARNADVPIVVDEVYRDFAFLGGGRTTAARLSDGLISVNSLTKVYGLPALRCGWIVANEPHLSQIEAVHRLAEFGASGLCHAVASQVLEDIAPFAEHSRSTVAAGRRLMEDWVADARTTGLIQGEMPMRGCMFFPAIPDVPDTYSLSSWLCETQRVALAPGEFFGAPGRLRIGFGQPAAQLRPALERLSRGLVQFRDRPQ